MHCPDFPFRVEVLIPPAARVLPADDSSPSPCQELLAAEGRCAVFFQVGL